MSKRQPKSFQDAYKYVISPTGEYVNAKATSPDCMVYKTPKVMEALPEAV